MKKSQPLFGRTTIQLLAISLTIMLSACGSGSQETDGSVDESALLSEENVNVPSIGAAETDPAVEITESNETSDSSNVVQREESVAAVAVAPVFASVPTSDDEFGGPVCEVGDLGELKQCMSDINNYGGLRLNANLSCEGGNCCDSGNPLIDINKADGLIVEGQGFTLFRGDNHKQCGAIRIRNSSRVAIRNIVLDEDQNDKGCLAGQGCPRTVNIVDSNDIEMDHVHVMHSKAYSIFSNGVNGFQFTNGSVRNAGIVGLYIGHKENYSSNVLVENSEFVDVQVNAVALLGVAGDTQNIVRNNLFLRNHWYGHWDVAARFGEGKTGGGQLYVQEAENFLITDNEIHDGFCVNCFTSATSSANVSGIEIGEKTERIKITSNRISNNGARGISFNASSPASPSVEVVNNTLFNNPVSIQPRFADQGGTERNNDKRDTEVFESFESSDVLDQKFQITQSCALQSSITRQCGGPWNREGNCAVELDLGTPGCESAAVSLVSEWFQIKQNQNVSVSGWIRHGRGSWCVEFADSSMNPSSLQCEPTSPINDSVQGFVGSPVLDVVPPNGSRYARMIVRNESEQTMIVDDIKLTGVAE